MMSHSYLTYSYLTAFTFTFGFTQGHQNVASRGGAKMREKGISSFHQGGLTPRFDFEGGLPPQYLTFIGINTFDQFRPLWQNVIFYFIW